jgi:hypothetical protein
MLALVAVGGAVVGFGIARSVTYERWVRDRRDRAAIAQRQRINEHFNQRKGVQHVACTKDVDRTSGSATRTSRT